MEDSNIEFLEETLEKAKNSEEVITNEQVWNNLKRNIVNLSQEFDMCVTDEDTKRLAKKSDSFNKFATNVIKGLSDSYNEQNRGTEYALKVGDLQIRKAHEINEAIRLTQTNKDAGQAIIMGIMQILDTNTAVPKISGPKVPEVSAAELEDVVSDITFNEGN